MNIEKNWKIKSIKEYNTNLMDNYGVRVYVSAQ
jgi:hypothetical protein